jgi:PAS domain S-box-containing protein
MSGTHTTGAETDTSTERLALAIEGANDGLWDWDIAANTVYYSPRWKAMLGYEDDEISDAFDEWTRRIHPDDRARCLAAIAEHLDSPNSMYRLEHRLRHKDGSWRWILTRAASLRDASGRAYRIAGWHTDITERRARESQVKERERQYHDIFESTSDGLILNDLKTGRVVEANPAACAMHGYTHKEFIGLHPKAFIMPENHEAFERYMQAAREGRPFRTHAIDVRKDGSLLHVEIHGSTIAYSGRTYVLGVVRDVSERAADAVIDDSARYLTECSLDVGATIAAAHNPRSTQDGCRLHGRGDHRMAGRDAGAAGLSRANSRRRDRGVGAFT